jgi:hypothetical protein
MNGMAVYNYIGNFSISGLLTFVSFIPLVYDLEGPLFNPRAICGCISYRYKIYFPVHHFLAFVVGSNTPHRAHIFGIVSLFLEERSLLFFR